VDKKRAGRQASRCPNRMRVVEDLDELVWTEIRQVLERPDLLAQAVASRHRTDAGAPDWQAELASYERQLAALERAEAVILDRFRRGKISEGAMDREQAAAGRQRALLERNRDLARQQLSAASQTRAEADALAATVAALWERVAAATPEQRQHLARLLIPGRDGLQVTLWRDRVEIVGRLADSPAVFSASAAGWWRGEDASDSVRYLNN
jgi:hypothetical protein